MCQASVGLLWLVTQAQGDSQLLPSASSHWDLTPSLRHPLSLQDFSKLEGLLPLPVREETEALRGLTAHFRTVTPSLPGASSLWTPHSGLSHMFPSQIQSHPQSLSVLLFTEGSKRINVKASPNSQENNTVIAAVHLGRCSLFISAAHSSE